MAILMMSVVWDYWLKVISWSQSDKTELSNCGPYVKQQNKLLKYTQQKLLSWVIKKLSTQLECHIKINLLPLALMIVALEYGTKV